MEIYSPKRGTHVSNTPFQQLAEEKFRGNTTGKYETSVQVDGETRSVDGHIIDSENPVLNSVHVGTIDMENRKDWVHLRIDQVEDTTQLAQIVSDADDDVLETAATAKNAFLTRVTGYDVQDLTDQAKQNVINHDSPGGL